MKWLKRLSHRFWVKVGQKIEQHREPTQATIYWNGEPYLLDSDKGREIERRLNGLEDPTFLDRVEQPLAQAAEQQEVGEAHADEMMGRILKGYDKH